MAVTKIEQYFEKLKAIKSAESSPNTEDMQEFILPDGKTKLYFPKDKSDEAIKERLSKYIAHSEKYIKDNNIPEFMRVKAINRVGSHE